MKLTPKQQAFADYYIQTGNATEAARKAGYSDKTAKEVGYENLTKPHIKQYVQERMSQKEKDRIASQDEVLEYLTSVLRGEAAEIEVEYYDDKGNLKTKPKKVFPFFKERNQAAELLGKRYLLWTEKQQVELTIPTFVEDVPDED
ncbi:terminase small subunit [Brevibacillus laterosporus]|uniref:terminase small subunit n=1 Tax=Brevibacillus laterosporus TaxID=1465 RepID=UPI003D24C6C0